MKWLLLILTLPTENASARMRAWRALKSCGAAALRDGVYLLPENVAQQSVFAEVAKDIDESGGQAYLLVSEDQDFPFAKLFDRSEEYRALSADIQDRLAALNDDAVKLARKLRKQFAALTGIDFFPGEAQRQVLAQLDELDRALHAKLSPDEPTPGRAMIARLDPADFQGRVWATRARPWVDRLASAWLIRRFIDPQARLLWLASPADCPADALGFDFDGARFSHTEAETQTRVSFETLLASFGLDADAALNQIARVVHCLDVGGLPAPEAPGLETLLAGMRASLADDDALLAAARQTFDFLYAHYQHGEPIQ